LYFFENATTEGTTWDHLSILRGVSEGTMTRYAVNKKEPLRSELESFIATVNGKDVMHVSGEDGKRALEMAQAMIRSGQLQAPVEC